VKNTDNMEETSCTAENNEDGNSVACKVRRRIEDYLEQRRYQDELGDIQNQLAFGGELE